MIYLNPADRPPPEFHSLKTKLNEEFNSQAKIKGLVSYIYYPTGTGYGHAKIEIDGTALVLKKNLQPRFLSDLILQARAKGKPFYRFLFTVTPNQLKRLNEEAAKGSISLSCSMGALSALSKSAIYSVPQIFSLLPSTSFLYLKVCKRLGSRFIEKIELYDNPMLERGTLKKWQGAIAETCLGSLVCYNGFLGFRLAQRAVLILTHKPDFSW